MAVLSQADRDLVFASYKGSLDQVLGDTLTCGDLKAAVTAADAWVDANAAAYNNALPTAVKNALTTTQKARLLEAVVRRRFEIA